MNSFDDFDTDGSFCDDLVGKPQVEAYMKYFVEELKPGTIIPPCKFQDWLHPELKLNYTTPAEGYPIGWLRMK